MVVTFLLAIPVGRADPDVVVEFLLGLEAGAVLVRVRLAVGVPGTTEGDPPAVIVLLKVTIAVVVRVRLRVAVAVAVKVLFTAAVITMNTQSRQVVDAETIPEN